MSLLKKIGIPLAGGAMLAAVPLVSYFEGKENNAYRDPVGVVTICYGHTGTARIGQTLTDEECRELLAGDLGDAFAAVDEHVEVEMPPTRRAALASFVFNVGEGAFQRSTLLRKLNAGQWRQACDELVRWVYADGEWLRGLYRRRHVERELCLVEPNETQLARSTDE